MEISEREYLELRMQVRTLQSQVDSMNAPKKKTSLKDAVREQVISSVWNLDDAKPIFGYSDANADAWLQMLALAKAIHEPSNLFYMDKCYGYDRYNTRPYIRSISNKNKYKKVSDLTPEQFAISVQMLDELIPIYNRYFKLLHQKVMYDPTGKGDYEPVGVLDEQLLKEE